MRPCSSRARSLFSLWRTWFVSFPLPIYNLLRLISSSFASTLCSPLDFSHLQLHSYGVAALHSHLATFVASLLLPFQQVFGLVSLIFSGFSSLFTFIFSDLSDSDIAVLDVLKRTQFSVLFYLLHSISSKFRDLGNIHAKYFIVPISILSLGLAFFRPYFPMFVVIATLWVIAAVAIFLDDERQAARTRRDLEPYLVTIRDQRRAAAATVTATGPAARPRPAPVAFDIDSCVICLEDFSGPAEVERLGCGHPFHSACIQAWIGRSPQQCLCPYCRAVIRGAPTLRSVVF